MPDVKMNYQQMEEMAKVCKDAARSLEESMQAINGMAGKLGDGFQGMAGEAMQAALKQILLRKMQTFDGKMKEVSADLFQAAQDTRDGVTNSKSPYGG